MKNVDINSCHYVHRYYIKDQIINLKEIFNPFIFGGDICLNLIGTYKDNHMFDGKKVNRVQFVFSSLFFKGKNKGGKKGRGRGFSSVFQFMKLLNGLHMLMHTAPWPCERVWTKSKALFPALVMERLGYFLWWLPVGKRVKIRLGYVYVNISYICNTYALVLIECPMACEISENGHLQAFICWWFAAGLQAHKYFKFLIFSCKLVVPFTL